MIEKFLGNWNLISMTMESDDGEIYYPIGKEVNGLLIYTNDGLMSAQLGSIQRTNFKNPDYRKGKESEIINSFNNYISYFGKFEINKKRNFVVHKVEQSLFPNWIGTKVKRYYSFEGSNLVLKATPISNDGKLFTPTLRWENHSK
ncbi:lipocalin-like domain-containing protein [Candidatus Kapabacteria bacterium]|nr:lipocalin-like domain-containing protein [Candidatus Kapabacteria bacterium]